MNSLKPNKIEEIRCKKCNSNQVYFRQTTNEQVCKRCGFTEKLEESKK